MFRCRVGIDIPKIEVRFEHLSVEGDVYVGSRALPTLFNATMNTIEVTPCTILTKISFLLITLPNGLHSSQTSFQEKNFSNVIFVCLRT